jgi:hypothetical protein
MRFRFPGLGGWGRTGKNRRRRAVSRKRRTTRTHSLESLEERQLLAFNVSWAYHLESNPGPVVVADFNGDAQPDLATANDDVSVLLGINDGSWFYFDGPTLNSPAFSDFNSPISLVEGDVNKDGKLDLVTANYGGGLSVVLGNGDGTFQQSRSLSLPDQFPPDDSGTTALPQSPHSVAVGDLNGDGALDLVATGSIDGYFGRYDYYDPYWQYEGYGYRYYSASYVNVLLGDGNGGFGTAEARFLGYDVYPWHVTVADLNADGHDDVIIAKDQGLSVLLGDGTGSLGNAIDSGTGSGIGVSSISLGDVDGDGNLDTLLTDGQGGLSVQRGDGQGSFTAMPIVSAGGPIDSAVMGDVNGDGMLDLVAVGSYQGDFSGEWRQSMVLLGDGVGNFAPPRISGLVTNGRMGSIALEDLNGDGFPELVTVDSYNDAVVVATNSGDWNLYSAPSPATIGISDATVVEGDGGTANAVFTVSIEGDFDNVSVDYATVGSAAVEGSDYAATSGTLTFAAGETSQTISVPIIGDTTDEYDEQFFVDLSNAAGGEITDSQGIGTIQDDDPAPLLTINDVSKLEGNHDTTFVFTVSLSAASAKWVYVDFATADGTATAGQDYVATSGTLVFAPGELTQTITVTILGDRKKEPDEFFYVTLSGAVNGQLDDSLALAMILNDDSGGSRKGRK